ncbi:probable ATP-dependent RNA helicase DHX34 [Cimex lectularius]|uniref:ATP-dependent RNA helicase DHX34 n=1 Tax=Cimex lectularius TaxID=79782 RepID=A0A8I6S7T8_CIMLE|nr:probable ATP-dependent RNA helicase DHX34 [Cimex lectularius]
MSFSYSNLFRKRRNELKSLFSLQEFIEDLDDFQLYLTTYDGIKRKASSMNKGNHSNRELYSKIKSHLKLTDEQNDKINSGIRENRHGFSKDTLEGFRLALLSYLLFKKNENDKNFAALQETKANLPVTSYKDEILSTVSSNRVTIIAGDTGCGKSTQVPQYLMNAGYNRIACTQPRRIACIALAKRVAFETQNKFGDKVGYQIRFESIRKKDTKLIFMTEGFLLRQAAQDGLLSEYDVIILDEVHERNLYNDFLLGILKCLIYQRKDLKVVLMSATINISLFSEYFGDIAKVIQVPGRLHPIEVHFSEVPAEKDSSQTKLNAEPYLRILRGIDQKYPKNERGDVLIFVSGLNEIESLITVINGYNEESKNWIPLPLHSSLSLAEQNKVFNYVPQGYRKCVVSTNIAETSVTIDGIRFVIDSGKMKEMSYDATCKMSRLKEFWVSKASAEQRKGRAGRTGPGVCFRLYTREDYEAMQEYTTPEIKRVQLDSLILQMISMGLPNARKFPFIEPPSEESIENSIQTLKEYGALRNNEKLTHMGELLAKLPVDIPVGKMLICGTMFEQADPALSLAATISVQTPFTNRAYRDETCESLRKCLESDHGDPITLLNCLKEWLKIKNARDKSNSSRNWCRSLGLEEQRFYEMCKIRAQFKVHLQDSGLLTNDLNMYMTSEERALRHGELRVLKRLKRTHNTDESQKKKKFLKPDGSMSSADNENGTDVHDIEFWIKNSQPQLKELIQASTACSYKDITILKTIVCSGLYPQVALIDVLNHHKNVRDHLFHTKHKPYLFLHPMSYFSNNPDVLQLNESKIINSPGYDSRSPLSEHHQVLFYMTLLKTNKAYLVHTMRMPAAQSVLIFANDIHTNGDFTCILCDSWIQFRFPDPTMAETFTKKIIQLRTKWGKLIDLHFAAGQNKADVASLRDDLTNDILKIMRVKIRYAVKRILPADLKHIFVGTGHNVYNGDNPFHPTYEMKPNSEVGGTKVAPYLTYHSISDSLKIDDWDCPYCDLKIPLIAIERLQHLAKCNKYHETEKTDDEPKEVSKETKKPNGIRYECEQCNTVLYLTPVEILKHKKSH